MRGSVILLNRTMVYLKSILVGLGLAVLTLVLLAAAAIAIGMRAQPGGVGAVAVGVSGPTALIAGAIMFAVGFGWMFRRSKKASPRR
jgi:hypothetical protein